MLQTALVVYAIGCARLKGDKYICFCLGFCKKKLLHKSFDLISGQLSAFFN